jgi:TPR repeat protein
MYLINLSSKVVIIRFRNVQGKVLYTFVNLMPSVFLASAPAYAMSLTHVERLCAMGYGLKGKLVQLLSQGTGRYSETKNNWKACNNMMACIVNSVASKHVASMRDKAAKEAEELCASGQCAAALVLLQKTIDFGHLPSRALLAQMLIEGREGVAVDHKRGFELVEEGSRLGCHHCQGVMAWCYFYGHGIRRDAARSLELARESSGRGSRYGQLALGVFYRHSGAGVAHDYAQALALFRLAAAQNFDLAQCSLAWMYANGHGVARDRAEALRLFQLAGAQGHPEGLFTVACCYEDGSGVRRDWDKAISWYMRAQAAGDPCAADALKRLKELRSFLKSLF